MGIDMGKLSLKGNRYLLVTIILVAIVFLILFSQNLKRNKFEVNKQLAENFFIQNLYNDGAIATNPGNMEFVEEYATGNQVLSESQGLWMQYCLLINDQKNFDKAYNFLKGKMIINNFISYRYVSEGELFNVTSAVDDFRIVGALLEAQVKWGNDKYKDRAIEYSQTMYETIIQKDNVVDFYDITYSAAGGCLTLCYADFKTMDTLIHVDERWKPIFDNSLKIIKEGYLGDSFPCFASFFDYSSNTYNTQQINMVQSLITAIHLADVNQCPEQTIDFIEKKVKSEELFGSYLRTGEPIDNVNSTAVYALAAILGSKTGNKELEDAAISVMIQFQVLDNNSELYGGFADINTKDAFSFDNLNALIAMQMKKLYNP
jgi:hypothetical protein